MLSRAAFLGSRPSGLLNTGGVRGRQCKRMAGEARKGEREQGREWRKEDGLSEAEAPGWVCWDRFLGSPGTLELHPVKTGKPQEALSRSNVGGKNHRTTIQ